MTMEQRGLTDHLDNLVVDVRVENSGHEASSDALGLVGSRGAPRQDVTLLGLHSDDLDVGILLLQVHSSA